mgnify:CR=1 FL=1|tara:strand:- start:1305 stop:2495 length:1191 start_codon:yes stop_codon:yes gene_type:complete
MNYKYIGIGSIISIIILYLYFRFGDKKTIEIEKRTDRDTKLLFQKLQKNDKVLKLLLSHTIRYLKRDKYSDKQLLDRLNKDSLFNKDYETVRILVDTHNITNKHPNNFDVGNYVFDLNSGTDNITGGLGRYKNVIGFRLIHAIMPNAAYIIDETNDIVVYSVEKNASALTGTVYTTLKHGYYTLDNLPNAFPTSNASFVYDITDGGGTISPLNDICIFNSNVTYNSTTLKFSFTANNSTDIKIKFLWGTGGTAPTIQDLISGKLNVLKKTAKLFGFNPEDQTTYKTTQTSTKVPDMSIHYTDLVVDEIPYIACKNNPSGHHVVDRIPLNVDYGSNVSYEPYRDPYQNYFLPISLSRLTIKLLEPIHGHTYNPQDSDHSLEFELTMIKNEKNVGLFN